MSLDVVYGNEGLAVCDSKRLGKVYADEQCADESGVCRNGYSIDIVHSHPGNLECLVGYG